MGLFRVTLIDPAKVGAPPIKLCDSADPLPTFNIRINHQPVFEFRQIAGALFGYALFHGNRRNTLSFEVSRNVDGDDIKFKSPGAAIVYAIKQTQTWPGLCVAKIEITDAGVATQFFLQNCAAQQFQAQAKSGIDWHYTYALNGANFTNSINA